MSERPAPTAEGSFDKTPFAHVLVYARERSLTGTLAVQASGEIAELVGESLFAFSGGALAQAKLPRITDPLGYVLREMNAITDEQLAESLKRLQSGQGLQGEILQAMGACSAADIEQALRVQIRRKATRMFGVSRAAYQYFDHVDLLAGFGRDRVAEDVFSVLWRGVRAYPNQKMLETVLGRVGTMHLRLRAGADLRVFGFDRGELGVLDLVRAGPTALDALVRAASDPRIGRAIVYVLLIAKQLETVPAAAAPRVSSPLLSTTPSAPRVSSPFVSTQPSAPSESPARVTPPPRPAPPAAKATPPPAPTVESIPAEHRERFVEAQRRAKAIEDENYFEMLGVATTASPDAIREAFLGLAARWHPDRAPASVPALRALHEQIFALLSEAQETLTHDENRGRYNASVQEGGGTPNSQRKIAALIEAATDSQKAEVCLKRREYAEGERLARRALAVSPDDPNAMTILAALLAEIRPEGPHDEAIKLLTRTVEIAPRHDRAHTLLGVLYKRRGDAKRALDHYRLAAAANPKNVDATREVRLAEMRSRTDPSAGDKPKEGLFSKLLKR
jgi:hypothetical protein